MKKTLFIASLCGLAFTACKKEETTPTSTPSSYSNGVFITHEGGFMQSNASVSFYNKSTGAVTNDLFNTANNRSLGDIVQSMTVHGGKGFIVVNGSARVEVVNMNDFKSAGVINLLSPRYALGISAGKLYISDWGDNGSVKVINPADLSVSKTIVTGKGPENMLMLNNRVYVVNSGGFGVDSTISVIDPATDAVVATVNVGVNPTALKADAQNKLWVLCKGDYNGTYTDPADDYPAELIRINPVNNTIEKRLQIGATGDHPQRLAISGDKNTLYYDNYGIYKFGINENVLPSSTFISKSFYGFDVDPSNGHIYGADAKNFQVKGAVFRYDNTGKLMDSLQVEVAPAGFTFN
jgi:YVTN family beta-propeller protein